MHTKELASCPICSGELVSLGISEDYEITALSARVTIDFAICRGCGFVCQSRALLFEAMMQYYQDSPKLREAVPSRTDLTLYDAQATFMERAGKLRATRVLDIGADMGKLLDHLLVQYGSETYYEEENRTAKLWLQQSNRHQDAGACTVHAPFDWIVLSQVLEHIVDPVAMLAGLRTRLGAEGKLFIEVPNHGVWDDLDVGFFFEHVNYFSPASLSAALDRAGYHLLALEVTTDAHYFEGRCRIIRACAQVRAPNLIDDAAEVVRSHERKHKLVRIHRIDALSRELSEAGEAGLALYGAAELASLVLRHMAVSGGRIAAVFDSDVRKHGLAFGGLSVQSPTAIADVNPAAIVILSSAEADIRRTIDTSGYAGRVLCWSELSDV
jgi:2-polyprenyl-3-methyl-5-hydroxy-6-metoxy-1,4-benzoquinol methylase